MSTSSTGQPVEFSEPIVTAAPAAAHIPPSVHVRAVVTWIAIFPLVTIGFYAIAPFSGDWPPVARTFLLTIVVVPLAVYVVVPRLMKVYGRMKAARR